MKIPKIIHQTGKSRVLPKAFETFNRSLRQLHPLWEFRFYDDLECRDMVRKYFPKFLIVYDGYKFPVQRADLFRLMVIYQFGGFYLDLDVECLNPLDDLCRFDAVFCEEKTLTHLEKKKLNHKDGIRIGNFMFGSMPGHPFFKWVMDRLNQASPPKVDSENDILETTGPGILTRLYWERHNLHPNMKRVKNHSHLCPYCLTMSCHFGDFARHHHAGSWRWEAPDQSPVAPPSGGRSLKGKQVEKIYAELKRISRS